MENPKVEAYKKLIGQPLTNSPSGVSSWLAGTLLEVEEGRLKAKFTVKPEMTNPMKMLHGGAISLILDDMIGATVYLLRTQYHYVSVNLNIDFLIGARLNDEITAETKIVRQGKAMINAEAYLFDRKNRMIAKCSSNLMATNIPKE